MARMLIKPPFSLILCCFLLASLFVRHGVVARVLQDVQVGIGEDDNGKSKAEVKRSQAKRDSSWVGNNNPPTSQNNGRTSPSVGPPSWVFQKSYGRTSSVYQTAPPPPPPRRSSSWVYNSYRSSSSDVTVTETTICDDYGCRSYP